MISIGKFTLPHGLMLAPMAGVTDRSMRRVCAECGAEYAVTEMVSAKALVYEQASHASAPAKTAELCVISDSESIPVAVQIFGSEPEFMAEAARLISTGTYRAFSGFKAAAVDINMGCPVKKVVGNGEGSALMKNPDKIYDIVSAVSRSSVLPVTVKIRAGWDSESINAPECARAAESGGAKAVCVHARTREMFYTPGIIPDIIGKVKASVGIPVFGNGDVTSPEDAMKMIRESGCDGIAIARGAIGNPWLFAQIAAALDGKSVPQPSSEEIVGKAIEQLRLSVADKGEKRGVAEVKYTFSHYVKGMRGATDARNAIMTAASSAELEKVIKTVYGIDENHLL